MWYEEKLTFHDKISGTVVLSNVSSTIQTIEKTRIATTVLTSYFLKIELHECIITR